MFSSKYVVLPDDFLFTWLRNFQDETKEEEKKDKDKDKEKEKEKEKDVEKKVEEKKPEPNFEILSNPARVMNQQVIWAWVSHVPNGDVSGIFQRRVYHFDLVIVEAFAIGGRRRV